MEDGLCSLSEVLSRRDRIMRDALAHGQSISEIIAFCHFKWSDFGGRFGVNARQTVGFQQCLCRGELYIMSNYLRLVLILWWDGNSA